MGQTNPSFIRSEVTRSSVDEDTYFGPADIRRRRGGTTSPTCTTLGDTGLPRPVHRLRGLRDVFPATVTKGRVSTIDSPDTVPFRPNNPSLVGNNSERNTLIYRLTHVTDFLRDLRFNSSLTRQKGVVISTGSTY